MGRESRHSYKHVERPAKPMIVGEVRPRVLNSQGRTVRSAVRGSRSRASYMALGSNTLHSGDMFWLGEKIRRRVAFPQAVINANHEKSQAARAEHNRILAISYDPEIHILVNNKPGVGQGHKAMFPSTTPIETIRDGISSGELLLAPKGARLAGIAEGGTRRKRRSKYRQTKRR